MKKIPFDKDELKIIGEFPTFEHLRDRVPNEPKRNTPITPRENFLTAFKKEMPLWMPTRADTFTFIPKVISENRARALVYDAEPLLPEEKGGKDFFGVDWEYVPVVNGSLVRPGTPLLPNANGWEDILQFPDLEAIDFEKSAELNAECINGGMVNICWIMNGLFERLISFMDFEAAAIALIDEEQQDAVKSLFDRLADMYIVLLDKFKKYYKMDMVHFHDDWGSQRSPFFSLDTCREMIVPAMRRIADHCHEIGVIFDLHSCGKNEKLVPAMIDAHVDSWTGQDMNDTEMLREKYGKQIIFGVMAPMLPPEATEEEAMVAAKAFVDKYGPGFPEAPVFTFVGPNKFFKEYLYEYSRNYFYNR